MEEATLNCHNCGLQIYDSYAYCPFCGTKTESLKNNSKGTYIIKPENLLVTGISILIAGLLLLATTILLHAYILNGLGLAIAFVGATLLVKGRKSISVKSVSQNHCKYCYQESMENWKYCCRCGSKIKR